MNKLGIRAPFHVQWEILYGCNLKCDFCNVWRDHTYDATRLKREDALHLVDELAEVGVMFLNLTGGEPLMLDHTTDVLQRAKEHGIYTSMNTNGVYVKDKVKELKKGIELLYVSLDSPYAKTHDELRGAEGCFSQIMDGIRAAYDEGINLAINMTVTKKNFDHMEKMCELATNLNVPLYIRHVKVIPTEFNDVSNASKLNYSAMKHVEAVRKLKKKYKAIKTSDAYLNFMENKGFTNYPCKAMKISLNIKPDGTLVLPCGYFPVHKFKKNGKSLKEIIKSKGFEEKTNIRWYDFCDNCTLSCFYVPTAMMDFKNYISLVKSYVR
ncbi:MAG: radical SAM/SPASM domain-containing protein [Candidatus Scalinduaceae bacterium]